MIDRFEAALVDLLLRELSTPHDEGEADFTFARENFVFEQPTRDKANAWTKPAFNIFLHDIRENTRLRGQNPALRVQRDNQQARIQRKALNLDLHYMITVWGADPIQEHQLLLEVLKALFRNEGLPDDLRYHHLADLEEGVSFKIAQYETQINPRDLWSVLDNDMRPAIDLVATVTVNPFHVEEIKLVRTVETILQDRTRRRAP